MSNARWSLGGEKMNPRTIIFLTIFFMLLTLMAITAGANEPTWVMKKVKPENGEIMQVNSAPVDDIYINEIHEKVQKKLKLLSDNEKKNILKETVLDRFERDGQWCFIKIVIRQLDNGDIIKEEIMECADTEHGKTDKEKIKELEKQIELEKAKKPGYWELFAAFYYKDLNAPEYCRLYSQPSHAFRTFGTACLTIEGKWEKR